MNALEIGSATFRFVADLVSFVEEYFVCLSLLLSRARFSLYLGANFISSSVERGVEEIRACCNNLDVFANSFLTKEVEKLKPKELN